MNPQDFVAKWRSTALKERAAAQEHFIDLCRLIGHPTPAEDDPTGERFAFEAGANKQAGGQGWADVSKRGFFAWEYKGRHADLDKAYQQLLQYRESLLNPPLLVVCDIDRILVHTNFTNTVKRIVVITLDDLLTPEGMRALRAIFYEPAHFRSEETREQVTRNAAEEFARLSDHLRAWGESAPRIAHFSIRLLFCLFAEDIEILPKGLFTQMIEQGRRRPDSFGQQLRHFFGTMAVGGFFGVQEIRHFDGGLFDSDEALALDRQGLDILHHVSSLDWSSIEPSVFGTLFQRSLDPSRRSQLGAHYTSKDDILLIVEPVLMAPLRREWQRVKEQARDAAVKRDEASTPQARARYHNEVERLILGFARKLGAIRVLDPACGSGNFLYVALRLLLELWKEVSVFASEMGLPLLSPLPGMAPSPEQLYGIEIDDYAYELAQATVWIGYIQWLHENGFGVPSEPILKPLDNIKHMDAILAYDEAGRPVEPEWPQADVIIGNPPFLGGKLLRGELSDEYVESIFSLYDSRVAREADLVCYWFERARALIQAGKSKRAGLLATQGIRGGANRKTLDRIKETGDIFWAVSDRDWLLEGAAVHVSMVGFDNGDEKQKVIDDAVVSQIHANLTAGTDLTLASRLIENLNLSFMGITPAGPFDIAGDSARDMLKAPTNPNGRPNSDVIHRYYNGKDLTERPRDVWIIDFEGCSLDHAALYEVPYEHVLRVVKPARDKSRISDAPWWLFTRSRPALREAIRPLKRYIATSMVSKHQFFCWVATTVLPANLIIVIARDDDYFFGVLHSKLHEVWSLRMGTSLEDRPRYTPTTTFETFPFPWPPGTEAQDDERVQAIAAAAAEMVRYRDNWLNPPGASEAELKKRTLTNLYNARPMWLDSAHKKLDAAVFAAYGWPADLSDEEILARLLSLNLERAGKWPPPSQENGKRGGRPRKTPD